ncbi:MAG: FG-GAP-like repeat-containing protein [Cyanophyceae cyanobacterium]
MPTLRVTTLADQNDGGASGGLSLRDAILTANADPDNEYIIQLQGGSTYPLTLGGAEENAGAAGDLDIIGNITIRAVGSGRATIDATGLGDRVFHVLNRETPAIRLNLENITVTGGVAESFGDNPALGGGILAVDGSTLALTNSTVTGNTAGDNGGGIFSGLGSTVTLTNSTVSSNSAGDEGGGIQTASGSFTLRNSTVTGNRARRFGGGIIQRNSEGTLALYSSTVSDNTLVEGDGGGIANNSGFLFLSNSTVNDNSAPDSLSGGGGIYNRDRAFISNSTVSGNSINASLSAEGGGIANFSGNLVLQGSTVSNNVSNHDGGGIHSNGTTFVEYSTVSNNFASGSGGGISTLSGTLRVVNSTVSNNFARGEGGLDNAGGGGGVANVSQFSVGDDFIFITNSTISGNSTNTSGGGIFNYYTEYNPQSGQKTTVSNSTITGNVADANGDGGGDGGGLYTVRPNRLYLSNSIVAGNFDTPGNSGSGEKRPDVLGPVSAGRNNLIGDAAGAAGTIGTGSDLTNVNPRLGPLADNGGPTQTHALLPDSPAINAGNNNFIAADSNDIDNDDNTTEPIAVDQRGRQRIAGSSVDIGAVESGANPLSSSFTERSGSSNPLNSVRTASSPVPTFADLDADGDLDAAVGEINGGLFYYRNNNGSFTRVTGSANPLNSIDVGLVSTPAFVDLDGDSDQDLLVGAFDGTIRYYRNDNGRFVEQTGTANPFTGIDVGSYSNIAFANLDGDGDIDAFLGLADGTVAYYQNNNGVFTAKANTLNPLNGIDAGDFSFPSFADIDRDGDVDALIGEVFGRTRYYRNDSGRLIEITGSGNPLNGVDVGFYAAPSWADVDGDGDLDAAIGGDGSLTGNNRGQVIFLENTPALGTASLSAALQEEDLFGHSSLEAIAAGLELGSSI